MKNLVLFLISWLEPYGWKDIHKTDWKQKPKTNKNPDHMLIFFSYMAYDVYYQLVCKTSMVKSLKSYKCHLLRMCGKRRYIWVSTRHKNFSIYYLKFLLHKHDSLVIRLFLHYSKTAFCFCASRLTGGKV